MRVLIVTYGLPHPAGAGAQIRDYHLIREVSREAEVSVCALLEPHHCPDSAPIRQYAASVETVPRPLGLTRMAAALASSHAKGWPAATRVFYVPELAAKIRANTAAGVDLVQIEHSFLACYRDAVAAGATCRTVLSLHNVGWQQYRRMARLNTGLLNRTAFVAKALLMRRWEERIARAFDHCLVVSATEAGLLGSDSAAPSCSIIENGVDCTARPVLPESTVPGGMLLVGVMGYPPNADAARWFCRKILPAVRHQAPHARLSVVGAAAPPAVRALHDGKTVVVTGFVDDVVPWYEQAQVAVVPVRAGGGTRLKILEAMALGRAVVSTSIGCEGLRAEHGRHLLIADSPADFAACVIKVLQDAELRERLVRASRSLVEEEYDWRIIGHRLLTVYRDLSGVHKAETCSASAH